MFSSPNSFSITAIFWPCASVSTRLSNVVLPRAQKAGQDGGGNQRHGGVRKTEGGEFTRRRMHQAFEVLAFRESDGHRVVRGGTQALGDGAVHPCVRPGASDDFAGEQVGTAASPEHE